MELNESTASSANGIEIGSFEEKLYQLTVRDILDFYDHFEETKWAFRALFELIGTNDSASFAQQENLRYGLERLLHMCLDKQEKHVEELQQIARNSPEYYLEWARSIAQRIANGEFSVQDRSRDVGEAIEKLDIVLSLFGEERYPEAEIIRKKLLSRPKVS